MRRVHPLWRGFWLAVVLALYAMVFYTRDSMRKLKEYEAAQSK